MSLVNNAWISVYDFINAKLNNDVKLFDRIFQMTSFRNNVWKRSCSMLEYLTLDQGVANKSITGVTALCPRARHINPCLVLVQPRKTPPDIAEVFLTLKLKIKTKQMKL